MFEMLGIDMLVILVTRLSRRVQRSLLHQYHLSLKMMVYM